MFEFDSESEREGVRAGSECSLRMSVSSRIVHALRVDVYTSRQQRLFAAALQIFSDLSTQRSRVTNLICVPDRRMAVQQNPLNGVTDEKVCQDIRKVPLM